ncbi:M16 family metallopeptidase [Pseudaestuariivita atlantica]|uniref:Peptidase M16 n=1 Tax=Pseudaestuariivita atlantica TaxID=1317121 RepID=A0A0L1JSY9_9RHOB|nr:pitrilysin family protein [Pseudaestuariivita atlantica]KNG94822.1 peptidase M16 [Pseudaestuariivita atlantica]
MTVQLTTLPNGLRIVTERMPSLQSASIGLWVTAGGRHETAEQNGIAHFLEHMAFKGTARRSALQIAEAIEDVGGYINAYTSREVTAYYARVLEANVPLALDVLADIVQNPAFDPREIEVERGVILQEIGQALDTPDDVVFDWLQEAAYPNQPMGRTILGPAERVGAFHADDFRAFTATHYTPDRIIVSAAGAVDHEALVAAAAERFGAQPQGPSTMVEPSRFVGGEWREIKPLEQAHFTLAFEAPGVMAPEFHTGQIYGNALGGGMSSRLFQELREVRGLCYTIYAQASAYSDTGMLTIYAGTGAEDVGDLARLTVDEMKRAAVTLSEAEVTRAKVQMKAGLLMGLESPSSRAERMARMIQVWGRVPDLSDTIAKIDAVTLADVRGFAERMAASAPAAMALYGPVEGAPQLDELQARRAA